MGYSSHYISRIGSFIHAILVSFIAIHILTSLPLKIIDNPYIIDYNNQTYWFNLMFIITYNYLFFDCILMLIFPTKGDIFYIIHHIIGGLGIYLINNGGYVWGIGLYFELTELSTILLNITWFLLKYKYDHTFVYKIAGISLLLVFFGIRWIGSIIIWYYMYRHYTIIAEFPIHIYCCIYIMSGIITLLNVYWGIKLIQKIKSQI